MDKKNVPQDNVSTYANNKKAMYATDSAGNYNVVASSGWKIEEEATMQAVHELERMARDAYSRVKHGEKSPLFFHMYNCRMDLQVLSESTGFFKWRIKRHFKPSIFRKLSDKILEHYGDTLGLSREELCTLPEQDMDKDNG
ncbi:MAG TPA: hypothetical protein EYP35_11615 [Desulfobacterales bacterium]|nr:hypothetical protein [Desulfobacterales bacterium]HIP37852.1 hypothetical protein [Desulfocapsa sulfexigens]